MTISIRPVLRKFPVSKDILEQSELPFGVVVTPNHKVSSNGDDIPQNLSGIPKCQECGAPHSDGATAHMVHNVLLCYLCGRTSTIADRTTTGRLFRLPLRLSDTPEYSLNAVACPPLWLIVLDGSCQERSYWNTMSSVLQSIVKQAPSHVHLALIVGVATTGGTNKDKQTNDNKNIIGVFDLKSAVPHIQHYYGEFSSNIVNAIVPVTVPHVQTALRSLMDYYPPNITTSSRLPVSLVTQTILNQLSEHTKFAGQREITDHNLCYAGIKLTFFLTQRPQGVKPGSSNSTTNYCWGGRVQTPLGQRFAKLRDYDSSDIQNMDEHYAELGRQCADIAVGVDLICLPQDDYVDFNLAAYSCLSHKSGAPPPIIVGPDRLETELLARVPWNESCVFGAELRLRLSPGYGVETFDHVYSEGGLFGPASQVGEHQLWRMGATSADTSYTIDLSVNRNIQDRYFVEGLGQVALKPVIQICFAYTKIIQNEDGEYVTVRQMKIGCCPVPLARSMEELYDNLDTESLAVVLYHKIALASLQDGVVPACKMAQQWLAVLLGSVYRSAEEQFEIQRRNDAHGVEDKQAHFIARERLLELEGELSSEDVLLGQGHERVRPIALMVYLLLQSDPLRESNISMDARCAALMQMASMPPSSLTRCIAPRLQLWGEKEMILEVIDLRSEAVQTAMLEYRGGTVLFLDTPHEIVIMDARYVNSAKVQSGKVEICAALQAIVKDAAESYGVSPCIIYELDQTESSGEQTMQRLVDCLIEDTPNTALKYENFGEFKAQVALIVQADLDSNE